MRVALLTVAGADLPTDFAPPLRLRIGAHSLAQHQMALALALGCERVVLIAPAYEGEMAALQHAAEDAGAGFHVVSGPRGLAGLVSASDEVVAFAPGLMASSVLAHTLLAPGPGVAVQPAEAGVAAGFERLDAEHAAAGAMRVPGRLVERLNQLDPDINVFGALQRLALQAGVPTRNLPSAAASEDCWWLVRNEAEAQGAEAAWLRLRMADGPATPSRGAARLLVRLAGPALLHAGSGAGVVAIGSLTVLALAVAAGWFGHIGLGLAICVPATVLMQAAMKLARVESAGLLPPSRRFLSGEWGSWCLDAALLVLVGWGMAGEGWLARGFAPAALLGILRLMSAIDASRVAAWLGDRGLLAALLALAAAGDVLGGTVRLLALGLLGFGIYRRRMYSPANSRG